jgi:hypothetical protein
MRITLLLAATAAGLAAACASVSSTPYQPAGLSDPFGYAEEQIEHNKMRVTFNGNERTDVTTVKKYVLYRAAEVTLKSGYDFFILADRGVTTDSTFQSKRGLGPRFGGGAEFEEKASHEVMVDIAMFRGFKPPVLPNAYDAREIQRNLGSSIERPTVS